MFSLQKMFNGLFFTPKNKAKNIDNLDTFKMTLIIMSKTVLKNIYLPFLFYYDEF